MPLAGKKSTEELGSAIDTLFMARTGAEYVLLAALVGVFLWRGFIPGWRSLNSDFPNYYLAARLYRQGYTLDRIYEWIWFQRQKDHEAIEQSLVGYVPNPLFAALVVLPLSWHSPLEAKRCWLAANLLLLLLTIHLLTCMTGLGLRRIGILCFLAVVPLRGNFLMGQHHVLILFLLSLGAYLYLRGAFARSGMVLALAAALKIYPALFVLYFLRKQRWRAVLGLVAGCCCLGMAHVALWGLEPSRALLLEVLPRAIKGEEIDPYSATWNSLPALLRRLFISEPELNPCPVAHLPTLYAVLQPVFSGLILVSFLWLMCSRGNQTNEERFEWGACVASLLLLSPHPASYQFCALVLTAVLLTAYLLGVGERGRAKWLVILYTLVCLPLQHFSPSFPSGWRTLLAFPRLYAMIALYLFLFRIRPGSTTRFAGRLRSNEARAFGVILLVMIAGGVWSNVRHFKGQFENYSRRLVVTPESLLAAEPATADGKVLYTTIAQRRYVIASSDHASPAHFTLADDAFHPTLPLNSSSLWVELASTSSRVVRFPFDGVVRIDSASLQIPNAEQPVVSGDGKVLAFLRETSGRNSLWIKTLHSGSMGPFEGERKLVDATYNVSEASLFPDGRIAFAAQPHSGSRLFVVDPVSRRISPLTNGRIRVRYPAVSPDGQWLAYSQLDRGNWQLYIAKVPITEHQRLTSAECNSTMPAWLPDSKTLVYSTDCGRGLGLTALARIRAMP
jgi:hypothetical protein